MTTNELGRDGYLSGYQLRRDVDLPGNELGRDWHLAGNQLGKDWHLPGNQSRRGGQSMREGWAISYQLGQDVHLAID